MRLLDDLEPPDLWSTLVHRLRDQVGSGAVALELTGDLPSAVAAVVACDALGPANVTGLALPAGPEGADGAEKLTGSVRDLALRTGLDFRLEPVRPMLDAFLANLTLDGAAAANLAARVRRVVLLALAEQEGRLVLDPIEDVPSGVLPQLARWRNTQAEHRGTTAPIPVSGM
jgi:NAD+ synthase (glutamine-hydrolysing)